MKQKREREEACGICGHYHDYEGGEPCGVCGHCLVPPTEHAQPPSALPTELLPGFLFLGSYDHASRNELLKTLGIDYILNTVSTCPNLYKNSFEYYTASSNPPLFEECFSFIEHVRSLGRKILVHCMSGNSRSPSVVMYYLMRVEGKRLDAAYAAVKAKRPSVALNAADALRLSEAEVAIFGPSASRFPVPIGKQAAFSSPQQQQQQQQQGPVNWSSPVFSPQQQSQHSVAAPSFVPGSSAAGPFVFGAQQ